MQAPVGAFADFYKAHPVLMSSWLHIINKGRCLCRWQRAKLTVAIIAVLLLIMYLIVCFTCNWKFEC